MRVSAMRSTLRIFLALSVCFAFASDAHADIRVASQLQTDGTITTTERWGTRFTVSTSTTVRSIALGIGNSCGVVAIGHLETIFRPLEYVSDVVFTDATAISGGFRFTGGTTTLHAGTTYYILNGIGYGPCTFGLSRTASSSLPQNAQLYVVDNDGYWLAQDSSVFGSNVRDIVYSVCSDTTCTLEPPNQKPDPVVIIPGILGSELHNGVWEIDPILHAYDDLIATFNANGYTTGVDLFTFPYDWHKSNVETAILLKQKIDEVKRICSCEKVDLVAHSMGGLVVRQYIQSDEYDRDVDQLIFLGTPHLGAPKAYLMWEGGEVDPVGFFNAVLKRVLDQEAKEKGYSTLFRYVQNFPVPSVRELLPIYSYIFDGLQLRPYPVNYPANQFLENLNAGTADLLTTGVRIYNFVGEDGLSDTINAIDATSTSIYLPQWVHGYPIDFHKEPGAHGLERGPGDETVPLPSASTIQSNVRITSNTHGKLPDATKNEVYKILTGKNVGTLVDAIDFPNFKLILIKILSPADLLVITPDGKKIGKDLTGQEVNQIPNAFYTGFNTDTEFLTILNPLDGPYKIYTKGTGSGSYTVEIDYITNDKTLEKSFSGNTTPGLLTELNFTLNNTSPGAAKIVPADKVSPVITITSPLTGDYSHSTQLQVKTSATDAGSGVYALQTFLDGILIPNIGSVELFSKSLGMHVLIASSTDNVGNATSSKRAFRVIATSESTLSDFERAYQLGWMNKLTYTILAQQFKTILTVSKNTPKLVAKQLFQTILKQIDQYRGKGLTDQGAQLLKADLEWLINN